MNGPGLARTYSMSVVGIEGHLVDVETYAGAGLVAFTLVGLLDTWIKELPSTSLRLVSRSRDLLSICRLQRPSRWPPVLCLPPRLRMRFSWESLPSMEAFNRFEGFCLPCWPRVLWVCDG